MKKEMMVNENYNYQILIVDDIPKNIQIVGFVLQQYDYDIFFANSGKIALKQTKSTNFDLILLDIMMPEMDGYEVCHKLKANEKTKDIPIIFLTAKTDIESTVKAFEAGGVDYITKPFNSTELLTRVKTHLKFRKNQKLIEAAYIQLEKKNKKIEKQKLELESINEKLSLSEENLKELNATKDKFFSIIAHDLKNPFNTLIGFTDFLLKKANVISFDKQKEFLQRIYMASRHGYNLLENLLNWSRSQMGKIKLTPELIDLNIIINENLELLSSTASNKKIEINFNASKSTIVFIDPNMIKTVIRNLISNALKFTNSNGTVDILIDEILYDKKKYAEVTVSDTGVGISPEDIEKLFRIDVNHSTIGTSKEQGTGLGLVLCKEFIEKNGGIITVQSKLGKGSKFIFTLPNNNYF